MNVVIVDDEPLARARLVRLLAAQNIVVQNEASNGAEALALSKLNQPDLVFLDVDMPGINGLEVANELNKLAVPPAIVFITAHPEHALDALQLNAAGYLVKPVSAQSLQKVVEQLGRLNKVHIQKQQTAKIMYQLAGTLKSIEMECIYYFAAEEKYTKMVFKRGSALIEQSLKQLEMLYPTHVLRVHRNTLVNKNKVIALHSLSSGSHAIELQNCKELLVVSRRELKTVKSTLC
ncbi:LytTR family DNA-binding domain-containing protein [Pseudoalteromonas sp. 20-MNA-CIBAN-0454]|uniref:LytR/AlgR family response regulator transcription factor n=1 Tax=Pseudoalteromonas sp. 20-MNA-CIBAN-0454 TaxID=3140424 RepID=UPI00332E9095